MNLQHTPAQTMENREQSEKTNTRLYGRWLLLARIGWVSIAVVSFSLFLLGLRPYATELHTICTTNTGVCYLDGSLSPAGVQTLQDLDLSVNGYVWYTLVVTVLVAIIWASVGLVIFWHRSDDWMALLVSLFLVMFNVTLTGGPMASFARFSPGWALPIAYLSLLSTVLEVSFFFLFPNGRFVPRWMLWIFILLLVQQITSFFLPPNSALNSISWLAWLNGFVIPTFIGIVVFSQIYRYWRVSTLIERQQTKWIVFGILIFLIGGLTLGFVPSLLVLQSGLFDLMDNVLYFIVLLPVPISIGMAILRYRLWDIDIIINRTLVYGTLTAILALVYFGLIFGLQFLLHGIISQKNDVAIVVSTLAIAALFQPLRHRIQIIIDRRFYRRKYNAAKVVEAFSATLRNEVDLNELREHLITVVQDTMQPAHVSLWLRQSTSKTTPLLQSKVHIEEAQGREQKRGYDV